MLGLLAADGLLPVSAEAVDDAEHDDLSISGSEQDTSAVSGRVTAAGGGGVVAAACGMRLRSKWRRWVRCKGISPGSRLLLPPSWCSVFA